MDVRGPIEPHCRSETQQRDCRSPQHCVGISLAARAGRGASGWGDTGNRVKTGGGGIIEVVAVVCEFSNTREHTNGERRRDRGMGDEPL